MIDAGQFPTTYTRAYQNFEATDTILSLAITDETIPAYWIGWLKWENLGTAWHLSRVSVADDVLHVEDVTRPENLDVGLVAWPTTSLTPVGNNNSFYVYKNGVWSSWSDTYAYEPTQNNRFLNKFDVNTTATQTAYLQFFAVTDDTWYGAGTVTLTPEEVISGTFTKTVSLTQLNCTITQDDVDGTIHEQVVDGYTVRYAVIDFGVDGFLRPINTSGTASDYYYPLPTVSIHDTDGHAFIVGGTRGTRPWDNWINGGGVRIDPTTGAISGAGSFYDSTTDVITGGFSGDMPLTLIQETRGNNHMRYADGCNYFVHGVGRNDISMMRRMYAWDDIVKILTIQMRYGQTNTYTTDSDKYYPHISDDNEFLCELINGATDRDELQPWQIAGTALDTDSNDYQTSDKPPYIQPDPDDRDKIGVSIDFNRTFPTGSATGLFTLYALRQVHVSKLGAKLWATLNDPDQNFWQNLQFAIGAFAETGSADISSVLEYITSIRIYPFALINLPGYTNAGTGAIRLGTGRVALDLGTEGAGNVGIMGQYTGLIDAGSAYIPQHFGDFRDLEDVSISVYLPYIGNIQLNPAEVTGCTIAAEYAVDLTSGSCVAYLLLSGSWGFYPIGIYSGTIGADIPLTASQGNRLFSRQIAATISPILAASSAMQTESQNDASGVNVSSAIAAARTAVQAVQGLTGSSLTPPVLNGGGANFTGFGAPQTAYVQIRRSQYAYTTRSFPSDTYGNRTALRATIGSLSGFTRCINPDVSKIPASAAIQQSIKAKLESGVYI